MNARAPWSVEVYESSRGSSPLVGFIEQQSMANQNTIVAELEDLAEFGLMPRGNNKVKHLDGKLWELCFSGKDVSFRFIYFAFTGRKFVLLHAFCKKTRKTPRRELDLARRRWRDYLDRNRP